MTKYSAQSKAFYNAALANDSESLATLAQDPSLMAHLRSVHGAELVFDATVAACRLPTEQHLKALSLLKKYDLPFNAKENSWDPALPHLGDTVLHIACSYKSLPVVRTLLNYGALVNEPNAAGETALHVIAASGKPITLDQFLLKHDVKDEDREEQTALYTMRVRTPLDVCSLLIERGANVNASDLAGRTPLGCCKREDIAKLLVDNKASPDVENRYLEQQVTPLNNPIVRKIIAERAPQQSYGDKIAGEAARAGAQQIV